eukprot:2199191-Amphidinium_carterae.1
MTAFKPGERPPHVTTAAIDSLSIAMAPHEQHPRSLCVRSLGSVTHHTARYTLLRHEVELGFWSRTHHLIVDLGRQPHDKALLAARSIEQPGITVTHLPESFILSNSPIENCI